MHDTSIIRTQNKNLIRRLLYTGKAYTKQEIAVSTGLSISTCNTLLNELAAEGEVSGKKEQLQNIGPRTMVYHINEQFEQILCISFEITHGFKTLILIVTSLSGNILEQSLQAFDRLDYGVISEKSLEMLVKWPNIQQVVISGCCVPNRGIVTVCDISELEGEPIVDKLSTLLARPVHLENDMHTKCYGCYSLRSKSREVITLANFPLNALPGVASIYKGVIIKGSHHFAGNIGYMPFDLSMQELLNALSSIETARPIISKAIIATIAMIDPSIVILTGHLVNEAELERIHSDCCKVFSDKYLPKFQYLENLDEYLIAGMYRLAIDQKLLVLAP